MADVTYYGNDSTTPADASVAGNWSATPTASDDVRFTPFYTSSLSAGATTFSAVAINSMVVEKGYRGSIGTLAAFYQVNASFLEWNGGGISYLDLVGSTVDPIIYGTASAGSSGLHGLYLIGTAIGTLSVQGGSVCLAGIHGQTSTATTVRISAGSIKVGEGCTLTNIQIHGGAVTLEGNVTNVTVENGTVYLKEDADITNLTMNGGVVHSQGRGSITTATVNSGLLNMKGNASRTITTLQINPGGQISYDPTAVTITNRSAPSRAIQISTSER
jgi:hypothetical protein